MIKTRPHYYDVKTSDDRIAFLKAAHNIGCEQTVNGEYNGVTFTVPKGSNNLFSVRQELDAIADSFGLERTGWFYSAARSRGVAQWLSQYDRPGDPPSCEAFATYQCKIDA